MTTLTETIRELRDLLGKSTKGKWELEPAFGDVFVAPDYDIAAFDRMGDATLVVAMQNALPALLDAAERAERYEKALTPSAETKATYIGEFGFTVELAGEDGPFNRDFQVPWTTIKEIMKAISKEALAPQTDTAAPSDTPRTETTSAEDGATRKDAQGSAVSPVCKVCGGWPQELVRIDEHGMPVWKDCPACNGTGEESK